MVSELYAHDNFGSGDEPVVLPEQHDSTICLMSYLKNLQQPRNISTAIISAVPSVSIMCSGNNCSETAWFSLNRAYGP